MSPKKLIVTNLLYLLRKLTKYLQLFLNELHLGLYDCILSKDTNIVIAGSKITEKLEVAF